MCILYYDTVMEYVVLAADIVRSREIVERGRLIDSLIMTMDDLNSRFHSSILSRFRVVRGDQFQGLLESISVTPKMILHLKSRLYPWRVRVGVGMGGISTDIMQDISLMDGETFLRASEALDRAKKKRRDVVYNAGSSEVERVTEMVFAIAEVLWQRWDEELWRRCELLLQSSSLKEVAQAEGVTYQAVHKSLKNMGVLALLGALEGLEAWFKEKANAP